MDRRLLIGIGVVLLGLVAGYFLFVNKPSTQTTTQEVQENFPTISKDELGLEFILRADKKAAKFTINKIDDIDLVEYQISYTKEVGGEEVPEGLIGEVKREKGDKTLGIDFREFGTCSSGVCRFDKVVSDIKLILKITKSNGKVYQAEDTLEL